MAAADLSPDTSVVIPEAVLSRELDGERILLDSESGLYFSLDPVGSRIWTLLAEGRRLGEIHSLLQGEYEVEAERAWRDLIELTEDLRRHGLIRVSEGREGSGGS